MKLKAKSFKMMERTDALLKMLALSSGVTEVEIIECALEQFAENFPDKNILSFIKAMYGEKVDRNDIRTERKRNSGADNVKSNIVVMGKNTTATLEEKNINNEVEGDIVTPVQENNNKEVIVKDDKNDEVTPVDNEEVENNTFEVELIQDNNKEVVIKDNESENSENDEVTSDKEIAITKVDELEEEIKNSNSNNEEKKVSLLDFEDDEDDGYVNVRDMVLKAKEKDKDLNSENKVKKITLNTVPEGAMDLY